MLDTWGKSDLEIAQAREKRVNDRLAQINLQKQQDAIGADRSASTATATTGVAPNIGADLRNYDLPDPNEIANKGITKPEPTVNTEPVKLGGDRHDEPQYDPSKDNEVLGGDYHDDDYDERRIAGAGNVPEPEADATVGVKTGPEEITGQNAWMNKFYANQDALADPRSTGRRGPTADEIKAYRDANPTEPESEVTPTISVKPDAPDQGSVGYGQGKVDPRLAAATTTTPDVDINDTSGTT